MKFVIHYTDGKARECDVKDFDEACKFANAYGGLVKKIEKAQAQDSPPPPPVEPEPSDRILRPGKTLGYRKRG